jgi:hypothetical protein
MLLYKKYVRIFLTYTVCYEIPDPKKNSNYFRLNKKVHNTVFLRKIPNKSRDLLRNLFGIFLKNTVL